MKNKEMHDSPETPNNAGPFAEELDRVNESLHIDTAGASGDKNTSHENPHTDGNVGEHREVEEQLRRELEAANDRVLRISAELDNYRKRVQREVQEERRYAVMPLMRDLLPIVDNLKRAISAADDVGNTTNTPSTPALAEGVSMVAAQFESVLAAHGCVRIEVVGLPFDPNFHDAILQQPSTDAPPNTVLFETQTGYRLHDRVVRPSQVIVSAKEGE